MLDEFAEIQKAALRCYYGLLEDALRKLGADARNAVVIQSLGFQPGRLLHSIIELNGVRVWEVFSDFHTDRLVTQSRPYTGEQNAR